MEATETIQEKKQKTEELSEDIKPDKAEKPVKTLDDDK